MELAVQAELKSGETHRVCWMSPAVKVGDVVTLKNSEEPEREWAVIAVYTQENPQIGRGWHAGGL